MKYAIMSDVHANPRALETALADARECGCARFMMLGDITGYGYDAAGAIKLTRDNFNVVLMGNHDSACVGLEPPELVARLRSYDRDVLQRDQLGEADLKWLRTRPHLHVEPWGAMVHGDFADPPAWDYIIRPDDAALNFRARDERLLFCGHTHSALTWARMTDGEVIFSAVDTIRLRKDCRYIVNVGSVGYPRHDYQSTYAIYDTDQDLVELRRLPFDFKHYIDSMVAHKVDIPDWLAMLLMAAMKQKPS